MKILKNNRPLFALVCGFEHSGTTLVSEILRQHPQLDSGFEGGFLLKREAQDFLTTEPFYTNSKAGWGVSDKDLSYVCDADNWAEVYLRLREKATVIKNKEVLLFDKTPRYMQRLSEVLKRVPDIPCIVIVKDFRSVFWSSYKRTKMSLDEWSQKIFKRTSNHTLSYARGWKKAIDEGLGSRILLIQYEELCLNQKNEVKKIFDFLGLEFNEAYLKFENPKHKHVYGTEISTQYLTEYKDHFPESICDEIVKITSEYYSWMWPKEQKTNSFELTPLVKTRYRQLQTSIDQEINHEIDQDIESLRQATILKPDLASSYYNWGIALLKSERFLEAQGVIHKAIELNPNFCNSTYVYTNLRNQLEIAFKKCPTWSWPAVQLGIGFKAQRQLSKAEFYLQDLINNRLVDNFYIYGAGFELLCQTIWANHRVNQKTAEMIKAICLQDIDKHGKQPWSSIYLGTALKVEGRLDEAYSHLEKASISDFPFNRSGIGCFSCKDYKIINKYKTAQEKASWINQYLSEIVFYSEDSRIDVAEVVLLVCCDSHYFEVFSKNLANSCALYQQEIALHFHIVNPEGDTWKLWSTLKSAFPDLPMAISYEEIQMGNLKPYYTMVRFLRANNFLSHYQKDLAIIDADSELIGSLSSVVRIMKNDHICLNIKKDNDIYFPWRSINAAFVFATHNEHSQRFFSAISCYLDLVFDPTTHKNLWWIDQNALFAAYQYCKHYDPLINIGNSLDMGISSVITVPKKIKQAFRIKKG